MFHVHHDHLPRRYGSRREPIGSAGRSEGINGPPDGGSAGSVAFPILTTEPDDWDAIVNRKVPGVWPEAADLLKASQPFTLDGEDACALPVIQGLSGTDNHRNLALCAAAAFSGSAITPDTGPLKAGTEIRLARADGDIYTGPVVPIEPGTAVEVARSFVCPDPQPHSDDVYIWASGIKFDQPPPPEVDFSFRANNGSEASIAGLGGLIEHVEAVVERFAGLQVPA
jgi:hypothetical protein